LLAEEVGVDTIARQQAVVIAKFDDASTFQYGNEVGILYG